MPKPVHLLLISSMLLWIPVRGDDYTAIDRHALNTPESREQSVGSLAAWLTEPARSDREKIRALFRWITANITYDTRTLFVGTPGSSESRNILKERKAVCDGYSSLFESLAEAAGFRVQKISGYAKGVQYRLGDHFSGPPDHAWNAVFLDGRWQLLDATWGAGHLDEAGEFVREFDEFYFLTDPEDLKYTHYPEDSRWLLTSKPVTLREFESMPWLKSPFFHYGLQLINKQGILSCRKNLTLMLGNPRRAGITAQLVEENQPPDGRAVIVQNGPTARIQVRCPKRSHAVLRIFARGRHDSGTYRWAMDYKIEGGTAGASQDPFPETFSGYYDHQVQLKEPLSGNLVSGKMVYFDLSVPGAVETVIIQGDRWEPLDRSGSRFTGSVRVSRGELQVGARFSENNRFEILLKYQAGP